jgi:hypothetical protein
MRITGFDVVHASASVGRRGTVSEGRQSLRRQVNRAVGYDPETQLWSRKCHWVRAIRMRVK